MLRTAVLFTLNVPQYSNRSIINRIWKQWTMKLVSIIWVCNVLSVSLLSVCGTDSTLYTVTVMGMNVPEV